MNGPEGGWRIGILGPVELRGPVQLGGTMERCLVAALAVHRGEAVSAESLVDALWGDDPPRTAAKTLQNYVLRVRRAMAGVAGLSIVTQPSGYCLRASPDAVDAGLAESLIAAGRRDPDPAAAARRLRQALDLWRGAAMQEFADRPFARAEASRLEELHEAALEDLFDAELALGRHHEVVAGLEGLVTRGPLRERRWSQLMVALYRDGRQAEALEAYGRLRRVLDQDLGVAPSAELSLLHQAILRHSPELAWRPPPRDAPGYFGRAAEMSRLLAGLGKAAAGRGGVVLLAGEPGIGKSHALRQLIEQARDGSAVVLAGRCVEGAWVPPFHPFAEAIAGYGESVGPVRLRADLAPALIRIAPRLSELLPDLEPPPALQPDEERFRLLDAAARFFTALSAQCRSSSTSRTVARADRVAKNCAAASSSRNRSSSGCRAGGGSRSGSSSDSRGAIRTSAGARSARSCRGPTASPYPAIASANGRNGGTHAPSTQRPARTMAEPPRACSMSCRRAWDLPMPGSPASRITPPRPAAAFSRPACSRDISAARPK